VAVAMEPGILVESRICYSWSIYEVEPDEMVGSDTRSSFLLTVSARKATLLSHTANTMTLTFDLGTPINTALFVYIIYYVGRIIFPSKSNQSTIAHEFKSSYSWMPKSHSQVVVYTVYTPESLAPFDGKDGGRILLAIDGIVFDVSNGRHFYGPGVFSVEKVGLIGH